MRWLFGRKKVKFLSGNVIESEPGRYVAFFDEFPEIIAQGSSHNEVKERLLRGLLSILEEKRKSAEAIQIPHGEFEKVSHFDLVADL